LAKERQRTPGPAPPVYTPAERLADAILHLTGVTAALVAVPVLVTLAAVRHGDLPTVTAASVYGLSLMAMFAASAAYHLVSVPRWKEILRRLDHAAIYVKIAGTYTPFAVLLGGEDAPSILVGIWAAALVGLSLKVLAPRRFEWLTLGLYLAMGWAVVVIGEPIVAAISTPSLVLVLAGGVLYTLGVVFHLWDRLPFQNAIWHGHVLAASFVFYAAILIEVATGAPG
jgi:hemolysin III